MKVRILIAAVLSCVFSIDSFAGGNHSHEDHGNNENHKLEISSKVKMNDNHQDINPTISLSADAIRDNNVGISSAISKTISQKITVIGKIVPELTKRVEIYPRFSGVVKSLYYHVGDLVKKDDVLLTIESNESLQNYSVKAPFSGELIKQYVNVGNVVKQNKVLYELIDLSSVWAELFIYRKDISRISKGNPVYINHEGGNGNIVKSVVDYISPIGDEHTQSIIARATLQNKNKKFIPGMYVDADIIFKTKKVPVAVSRTAIQVLDGKKVVFIEVKPNKFEAKIVKLGLIDDSFVQILSGLSAGDKYVSNNSFILKAELEKSSAEHTH